MKKLRIIYMGTPEFAVPSLEKLIQEEFEVVAVVTAPDKPKGRGQKLSISPVKECALAHQIPVLQPTNLKSPEFIEELRSYKADLQIVVAFRMLPEIVWDMPEYGTFNLHASLLPQYRGAAPINWAIINGEKETGLTTFLLQHEIDTGNILFQEKEPIFEEDNVGSLYERLMNKGADLVIKTAKAIQEGNFRPEPQDQSLEIKHAPKIFKETCEIDWDKPNKEVYNFIRGLSPYPAAWTNLNGRIFKIFSCEKLEESIANMQPGEYHTDNKTILHIQTADGTIAIKELQMQGKKRMGITDFMRGNKL
ncbi:methionyl-tRNA formyltransferase [Xanthovirga aplysinae]|uniref:methionyl-tRNA formyltransferase n=1 Tax=Xanthovirga aplysinae TaxID=2529853 RepID=UPI0012BC99D7|nr:methionyl-tRNA formyltransferase [Xanthovirga aplysinae]MTI31057.1 methionyl-tRNA formyltransferase [Xanthovirga aplysinae]